MAFGSVPPPLCSNYFQKSFRPKSDRLLGYHFERGLKWPRKQSLAKLKARLRAKTARLDGRRLAVIVADVNRSLRGWYGYFQHSQANTFAAVDGYVRRRLRSLLQWRRDGRGYGLGAAHQRWPNKDPRPEGGVLKSGLCKRPM